MSLMNINRIFSSLKNFKMIEKVVVKRLQMMGIEYDEVVKRNILEIRDACFNRFPYDPTLKPKDTIILLNKFTIAHIIQIFTEDLKKYNNMKPTTNVDNSFELMKQQYTEPSEMKKGSPFKGEVVQSDKNFNENMDKLVEERKMMEDEIKTVLNNKSGLVPIDEEQHLVDDNDFIAAFETTEEGNQFIDERNLIIQKPEDVQEEIDDYHKKRKIEKEDYLVIDSRSRNQDSFPEPNDYQVELANEYRDILEIELLSANIPKSSYNINSANNTIHFDVGGTEYTASVSSGNYDITTLLTDLETAMNAAGSGVTFTVTEDTKTNKITIAGTGAFDLLFNGGTEPIGNQTRTVYKESSIGYNLGFRRTDLTGNTTYTAQSIYNIKGENYVLLYIKQLENLETSDINYNNISQSFTKINLDTDYNTVKFYSKNGDYKSHIIFKEPLQKLSQMIIRFYNYNGSLYDFNGLEHSLYFRIKTLSVDWKKV